MEEELSQSERWQIIEDARRVTMALKMLGMNNAAETITKLIEMHYDDEARNAFYLSRQYEEEYKGFRNWINSRSGSDSSQA